MTIDRKRVHVCENNNIQSILFELNVIMKLFYIKFDLNYILEAINNYT